MSVRKGTEGKNWDQSTFRFAPNFATFQYLDILGCKFCPPVVHMNPSTVLGLVVHIPPIRNFLTRKLFSPTCLSSLLSTLRLRMRMETQIPTLCPMHALSMQTEDGDENWNRSQNLECHSFSSTCPCQFVGHRSSKVFLAHIRTVPSVIVWGDERRNECRLQAPSNLFSATSFCNLRLKFASFFSRGNVSSWIEARWGFQPNALGFDHEWMFFFLLAD